MSEYKISIPKAKIAEVGTPISDEDYKSLMNYAGNRNIKLSCFKAYVGDITIIEEMVDDIIVIARDFPKLLEERKSIVLELDFDMDDDDFATTREHIIHINARIFSNIEILKTEYNQAMLEGRFVKKTDWHAIIRHEVGHVVANMYHIDAMSVAKKLLRTKDEAYILDVLTDKLSIYATTYSDGRELISESFAGYYGHADNEFANAYVEECLKFIKGGISS